MRHGRLKRVNSRSGVAADALSELGSMLPRQLCLWIRFEKYILCKRCCCIVVNVQAVGIGDCDSCYCAGELAQIRSENRGKKEGTSREEPLGIHPGAHLINPPGHSTRAFPICKQDFLPPPPLPNPPSEGPQFVFVCFHDTVTVPVQSTTCPVRRPLWTSSHLACSRIRPIVRPLACPTPAVCLLCSSSHCMWSY